MRFVGAAQHSQGVMASTQSRCEGGAAEPLPHLKILAIHSLLALGAPEPGEETALRIKALAGALALYKADQGAFPSEDDGLRALVARPEWASRWNGPYLLQEAMLVDGWGSPWAYGVMNTGQSCRIISAGEDRLLSTHDDIELGK